MLGGGTFTTMNKVLSGSYINYVSATRAQTQLSNRGVAAIPMPLKWGLDGITKVTKEDFENKCIKVLGYSYDSAEMLPIREFFKHGSVLYIYNLNGGTNASCDISTAKCKGTRGNDIKHVVSMNVDNESLFEVSTYVGSYLADTQTVSKSAELVDNDFVSFKKDVELSESVGIPLTGGTDVNSTGEEHSNALSALEKISFNILGCMSAEETVKKSYAEFTKRMRDEYGIKFQTVIFSHKADYIGCISVKNEVNNSGADVYALVPWMCGAESGCELNKTCENMTYDGEYDINVNYAQSELIDIIKGGEIVFHQNGDDVSVLSDINTFVSFTNEMGEDFQLNQVIRVLDEVAIQQASIFNSKYIGKVQNNADGRTAYWNECVDVCKELLKISALEEFSSDDVTIEKGEGKRDVILKLALKPACAMSKLYSTIYVS